MKKFYFCALLILNFFPAYSYSEEALIYALDKKIDCKMPPKTPPKRLLSKSYKTYTYPGPWAIFDINGDGWCDWIRGGYEGYRLDQEEPTMRDFIYLGSSKGWKYYDSPQNVEFLDFDGIWKLKEHSLFSDAGAVQFFEPITVHVNNEKRPYIVTAIRYDAPAPPPSYDRIFVTRWSDDYSGLKEVQEKEKKAIWNFLKEALCHRPKDSYEKLYGPRIITMGPLCDSK